MRPTFGVRGTCPPAVESLLGLDYQGALLVEILLKLEVQKHMLTLLSEYEHDLVVGYLDKTRSLFGVLEWF